MFHLNAILNSSSELAQLSLKAQQHGVLAQQINAVIPASLRRSCRLLHFAAPTLVLAADNGAVAAKLRQLSAEIIKQLRAKGCEVTVIQVQVQVSVAPLPVPSQPRTLSQAGKNELASFAQTLVDSPLKAALERLGKHAARD